MPPLDDKQRNELLDRASEALKTGDEKQSHQIYRDIVETLTRLCNKNQKEIAAELQTLAKSLEQANTQSAFEFKQRTCEVMLELNMEERRRSRVHGAPSQPDVESGLPEDGQGISTPSTERSLIPTEPGAAVETNQTSNSVSGVSGQVDFSPNPPRQRTKIIGAPMHSSDSLEKTGALSMGLSAAIGSANAVSPSIDSSLPFLSLDYLYLGSNDYERDLEFYRETLAAQEVWKFDRFGSRITAFSLSAGPLLLIADHRGGPSCQPVFRVSDLESVVRDLTDRGWKPLSGPFGTPNGEAYSFEDPSGNRFAIYQVDETSTDRAFFDPTEYQ